MPDGRSASGGLPPQAQAGPEADGFVLVSVLWIIILVAGLSALFVNAIGAHLRGVSAAARAAEAEALADGAIRLVAFHLAASPGGVQDLASPRNGAWFSCELFEGVIARISVQDQDGLLDLNQAPMPALRQAFRARLGEREGERAVHLIEARRATFAGSASLEAGDGLGAPGDTNGPAGFSAVDEIHAAGAGDQGELAAMLPLLTVYSRSDGFDPDSAPADLLKLFGAAQPGDADGRLPAELVRVSRGRVFAVTADVGTAATGRRVRRAVVELTRQPDRPFSVLEWSTISAAPSERRSETASGTPEEGDAPLSCA